VREGWGSGEKQKNIATKVGMDGKGVPAVNKEEEGESNEGWQETL